MIRRLLFNAGSNVSQLAVNMMVTFIMAPIYIRMMGLYDYGLREMVMALTGYMGLLSIGMQPTVGRYISMYHARRERENVLKVYASSLAFMSLVGLLLGSVFLAWGTYFPHVLGEEGADPSKYRLFLYLIAIQLIFLFPMFVMQSFLEGLQRFVFKNTMNMICTVAIAVISYNYMTESNALILLVSLTATSVALRLFVFAIMLSGKRLGGWKPSPTKYSWAMLKDMLYFGSKAFVQSVAGTANKASDRLIIGFIVGPAAVAAYSIPKTLVEYSNGINMTLTQVFMPMFSDLNAKGQRERIRDIYLFSSKYMVALVMAMCLGIALIGGPFIAVWMPGQFDPQVVNAITAILCSYMAIHRLNPFAGHFLTAINKHGFLAKVMPVGALVNVMVSVWLVFELGVVGAAVGTLVPVFVLTPMILIYCCRHLGITVWTYITRSVLPALVPVAAMGLVVGWMRLEMGLESYLDLLTAVVAGALVFSVVFFLLACPTDERRFWLRQLRPNRA